MDEYQERYLEHQKRKKYTIEEDFGFSPITYTKEELQALKKILQNRRSQRIFNDIKIPDKQIKLILNAIRISPSSCNRQAIYGIIENDKEYISNTLVGAKGWANEADKVILLFASREAYKNPLERDYMPYLDAGVVVENMYLMSEVLGIGACFVNPNIREENKDKFIDKYNNDYFCGAMVLGHYDKKAQRPPLRELSKVLK